MTIDFSRFSTDNQYNRATSPRENVINIGQKIGGTYSSDRELLNALKAFTISKKYGNVSWK